MQDFRKKKKENTHHDSWHTDFYKTFYTNGESNVHFQLPVYHRERRFCAKTGTCLPTLPNHFVKFRPVLRFDELVVKFYEKSNFVCKNVRTSVSVPTFHFMSSNGERLQDR